MIQDKPLIQCTRLNCLQGNDAILACSSINCSYNAFICGITQCECNSSHKNCAQSNIKAMLSCLEQFKVKQISQKTQQSISLIQSFYDEIIEKISYMRQKFIDESNYFGLHPKSIQLVKKLNEGFMDEVTGKIIYEVQQEITKTQVVDLLPIAQIQFLWRKHQKIVDKLIQVFQQITRKITMRNYQIQQKLILISQSEPKWGKAVIDSQNKQSHTITKWFNMGRALQQITILNLNGLKIRQIPEQIAFLTGLRQLNLRDNLISEIKHVENLEHLRSINLSWNSISDISVNDFKNCSHLKQVLIYNRRNIEKRLNYNRQQFAKRQIFVGL